MVLSKGTASTQNAFVEWIIYNQKLHGAKAMNILQQLLQNPIR